MISRLAKYRKYFRWLRLSARPVALGLMLLGGTTIAMAQSAVCRQIESELASIGRGGGGNARAAVAARSRLAAVQGRMASIGCDRGGFLFGPQPPAECSALRAQAASYAAQANAANQQANGGGARRAQLLAALDANNCRAPQRQRAELAAAPAPQPQPARPRGFFEMLFGGGQSQPAYATETVPSQPLVDPDLEKKKLDEEKKRVVGGGPLPVCVRTCDGFFFPVNYQGAGDNDQYEEVCQASCPNASTQLFWMRAGADLDTAATEDGKPYSSLPTAYQYRQAYDPSCSCKKQGETWGIALRQADLLIRDRRSDITVTQERSDEMARPGPARELRGVRNKQAATQLPDAEIKQTNATSTATAQPAKASRALNIEAGETREVNGKDGEKKNVRVLVPEMTQ